MKTNCKPDCPCKKPKTNSPLYDPKRDGAPYYTNVYAEMLGDPPKGRREMIAKHEPDADYAAIEDALCRGVCAGVDRQYRIMNPDGTFGDIAQKVVKPATKKRAATYGPATAAWHGLNDIAKAVRCIESNGDREIISQAMGGVHKVRSFYNNILDPHSPNGDVTCDTHAIGAALLRALGGEEPAVVHGLSLGKPAKNKPAASESVKTGNMGTYGLYATAYRELAVELGIEPRQLQSVVWEVKPQLFSDISEKNWHAIEAAWRDYHDGKATLSETQKKVLGFGKSLKKLEFTQKMGEPEKGDAMTLPVEALDYYDEPVGKGDEGWADAELEAAIKRDGIQKPLEVGKSKAQVAASDNRIYVFNGNHRLAVAKKLGIGQVPVVNAQWRKTPYL